MSDTLFRLAQMIVSILGLVFSITSRYQTVWMIVVFAVSVSYLVVVFICLVSGKGMQGNTQPVLELILGIAVLVATIVCLASCYTDTMLIIALVMGFILPALFFISSYERIN